MITAKYYLENGTGERFSLNVGDNAMLKNISGLGMTAKDTFADIGDGFFAATEEKFSQGNIVFDIVFFTDAMNAYKAFVDWVTQSDEMYFVYNPAETQEYYRRVRIGYLTKTYRDAMGILTVPTSLMCLTPWYTLRNVQIELTKQTEDAIRFPFTFDTNLYFGSSEIGDYAALITGAGHISSALRIAYTGAATNPVITLTDNGSVIGKCKITKTLIANDVLEVSSEYSDAYVKMTRGTTVTDLIDDNSVDITFNPFCRVPAGHTCEIRLSADEELTGTATCKIISYYRSV